MGVTNFSIFSKFLAKDGVSPVFGNMTKSSKKFGTNTQTAIEKTKAAMTGLKKTVTATAAALTALGTAAIVPYRAFSDWEKGIKTVYTLLSKDEISIWGEKLKQASQNAISLGISVDDSNKALFDAVSAFGMSEKTLDIYNKSIVLAKAGNAELSTSLGGVVSVVNAWGAKTTDVTTVANAFFTAQKNGVTTVQELADSIGNIAPTARAAGVSLEETMATIAALTKGGMSTANATTSLTAVLGAFIKPTDQAKEVLQQYGIASDIVELKEQGLSNTLAKLIELQKKHPEEIARAVPKLKAMTGVLAMNEDSLNEVHKTLGMIQQDIKNGTGLNEALEIMSSTSAAAWAKMVGAYRLELIKLGEIVAPYIDPLIKALGEFAPIFGEILTPVLKGTLDLVVNFGKGLKNTIEFLKPLQVLLPIVSGLLSGLAVYKAVQFFQMMRVQAALFSMMLKSQLIPQILASIPAIWAQTAAILANPLFWIPAVIAGVITALVLLWKNWDTVTATIEKFGSKAKSVILEFWDKCKSVFSSIGTFIKEHFIDILLMALGPVGAIIKAIQKMPQILKALGIKGDAFEVKTKNDNKNPKENPQVKGGKQNGKIEVTTTIDNRTDLKASTNTSLQSSDNLNLQPA